MTSVLMPCAVRPLQIHAQQHGGPILRFGAAGAGLNIEKRIVRVHFARKHALKLEPFDFARRAVHVDLDFLGGGHIRLLRGQIDQFGGIAQAALQMIQADHDLLQFGAFLAQFLRAIRVVPNARLLEFPGYFLQALVLIVVIKDTSSRNRRVPRDL